VARELGFVGRGLGQPVLEAIGKHRDRHERLLEVVRGDRGEVGEVGVGALELLVSALERCRHGVEPAGEVADLVGAIAGHTDVEPPTADLAHGPGHGDDGADDGATHGEQEEEAEPEHERDGRARGRRGARTRHGRPRSGGARCCWR
jgi:hypothetical protein